MRHRVFGIVLAAVVPLAACEAGEQAADGELGDVGIEEGVDVETAPAAEMTGDQAGLVSWDTDGDQALTRDEWGGWYDDNSPYDQWNTDAQEGLTETELSEGAVSIWDTDDDDELTETEWNEGVGTWYGDQDYGAFTEWDANGDSVLDANEVAEGFERENLYDTVDRDSDALIDDEELADWWFDIWDVDDDQTIDTTEWDQIGTEWTRIGVTA